MPAVRADVIFSVRHPLLQEVRRALRRSAPTEDGLCVAEGRHLLTEALRGPSKVVATIGGSSLSGVRHYEVPDRILASIASTETAPGVISLVRMPQWRKDDLVRSPALVVILDGLQDPGNVGTILRSAEAFRATGVVFRSGTVSPYNSKLLRASAGSIFRLPFAIGELDSNLPIYAADPHHGRPAHEIDWTVPCSLAIGSEAHGVRPELAAQAIPVRIPTMGVESLNAAVSASILLYEASRQRRPG